MTVEFRRCLGAFLTAVTMLMAGGAVASADTVAVQLSQASSAGAAETALRQRISQIDAILALPGIDGSTRERLENELPGLQTALAAVGFAGSSGAKGQLDETLQRMADTVNASARGDAGQQEDFFGLLTLILSLLNLQSSPPPALPPPPPPTPGPGVQPSKATLHTIFVIDTNDTNIGDMVARDLGLMEAEVNRIVSNTGLRLNKQVFKGGNFKPGQVGNAIKGLQVGADDVILFYYSGHGFRTGNKRYKWPYHYFHSDNPVDFAWVIQALQAKGARLTVALTDACNNVVNIRVTEDPTMRAKASFAEGYKFLFLGSKGFVSATSSIPGETSTATADGSLFTLSFLKALQAEVIKHNPSWDVLMAEGAGKKLYIGNSYEHTPFYEMSVAPAQVPAAGAASDWPTAPQQQQPATQGGWQAIN